MKRLTLILMSLICICGNLLGNAPDTLWTKTYGGVYREIGNSVYQTSDGGYIIAGITDFGLGSQDVYLIKTDINGIALWTKTYGGKESDWGYAVQQTSDNGYIIVGRTFSFGDGDRDVYLIKTNSNGDTLWTKTYGGTKRDQGQSIQQTSDNGYIITGWTDSFGAGDLDVYLIKTNSNGDILWTRTFGGPKEDVGQFVQQTSDNGYIVIGHTLSFSIDTASVYLIKTNSNGDTVWTRTFGGAIGFSVKQTKDNGYILLGAKFIDGNINNCDIYLLKTDENGDTSWTRTYGKRNVNFGFSVAQTSDDGYFIAATIADSLAYAFEAESKNDIYLIRTDSNGDTLWTKTLDGGDADQVGESSSAMQRTSDNGFIIVGSTRSFSPNNIDVWLIKIAPESPDYVPTKDDYRPFSFTLFQNYPNPFNPTTEIKFSVETYGYTSLRVYDLLGREVVTLVSEALPVGTYTRQWDAAYMPSGVYFYRLQAGSHTQTKKLVLLR
jgi:hypothetical protein